MRKINIRKSKRLVQRVIVLALLMLPLIGFLQTPLTEAASCPKGQTAKIFGGTICKTSGEVTCSKGYLAQYNGSSMICAKPTTTTSSAGTTSIATTTGDFCGGNKNGKYDKDVSVKTAINLGCRGRGNPIIDALFAIIRFLTTGVGIVLVGSMIYAGIQYTSSRGDPQATASAVNRLKANAWALLLFLFGYAILNYIIPGTFLK